MTNSQALLRKLMTGEGGNGGEFAAHLRAESASTLQPAVPSGPSVHVDGDIQIVTGTDYNGWTTADEVAVATRESIVRAAETGEIDPGLSYRVESERSGAIGDQTVRVVVSGDASLVEDSGLLSPAAAELSEKLTRIAGSRNYSKHLAWAPPEHMYQVEVVFDTGDDLFG